MNSSGPTVEYSLVQEQPNLTQKQPEIYYNTEAKQNYINSLSLRNMILHGCNLILSLGPHSKIIDFTKIANSGIFKKI